MSPTVLVTGASGFIGRQVCDELERRDIHPATVTRTARPPAEGHVPGSFVVDLAVDPLDEIESGGFEICIHLAWDTDPASYLYSAAGNERSLAGSVRLLEALRAGGCRTLILAGSCLEADTGPGGGTPYAVAKRSFHKIAEASGMHTACCHIFSVFGPHEHPGRLVPSLIRALRNGQSIDALDGGILRNYLFVEDVCSALVTAALEDPPSTVDVCAEEAVPMNRIYDHLEGRFDAPGLIQRGATKASFDLPRAGDPSWLRSAGWAPSTSLKDALDRTVDWWTHA